MPVNVPFGRSVMPSGNCAGESAATWKEYYRLCQAGGSKGYFDLLKVANLSNPFEEGTVKRIVDSLLEDLF